MTDNRKDLDKLFATARTEPPTVAFDETRARVEAHTSAGSITNSISNTANIMTTASVGILAAALAGFLSWNGGDAGSQNKSGSVERRTTSANAKENDRNAFSMPEKREELKGDQIVRQNDLSVGEDERTSTLNNWNDPIVEWNDLNERERDETTPALNGRDDTSEVDADIDEHYDAPAPFIAGLPMIELSRVELGRLGLQPDEKGVWFFYNLDEEMSPVKVMIHDIQHLTLNQIGRRVDAFEVSINGLVHYVDLDGLRKEEVAEPSFYPVLVTDDFGNRRVSVRPEDDPIERELERKQKMIMRERSEGDLSNEEFDNAHRELVQERRRRDFRDLVSGELVPILVRTGYTRTEREEELQLQRPDCIFWYRQTPEFLAALPEHVQRSLEIRRGPFDREQNESRAAIGVNDSRKNDIIARCGPITATYSAVLPNPARDSAVARYTLDYACEVDLSLHGDGDFVRTFRKPKMMNAGENAEKLDLSGLDPGTYYLRIGYRKGSENGRVGIKVIIESTSDVATVDHGKKSTDVTSGAIVSSTVLPNPARDRAVVSYVLDLPRGVSLTLYDATGKQVRTISKRTTMKAGEYTEDVDLKGLAAGMYFLTVATDEGEQVIEKLIVE